MMTRKHFKQFAEVIKDNTINDTKIPSFNFNGKKLIIVNKDALIDDLCVVFKRDNSNFNTQRFIDACDERGGK